MEVRKVILLVASLTFALSMPAAAAQGARGNGPCRQDVERLCPGIKPGGGAIRDCLKQHATELSPACQERVKQMKAQVAAWREACEGDVQKLCAQVEPGHGNIRRCLHEHRDQLSQTCKDQIAQHRRGRHAPGSTPGSTPGAQ